MSSRDKQKVLGREGSGQVWAATGEFAHHRSAPFTNHNAVSILVRRRACPATVGGDRPAGLDQSSQTVSNARPRAVNVSVYLSCVAVFHCCAPFSFDFRRPAEAVGCCSDVFQTAEPYDTRFLLRTLQTNTFRNEGKVELL